MILNPLSQNFAIWMPANFFYSEVVNLWMPVFKRKFLPYVTIEDMFTSQITGINFPSVTVNNVTQGQQNYTLTKRGGRQLDQEMDKTVTLTVKLSEAYMTYFIARQQMDLYLKYGEGLKDLYMGPLNITILDEGGFENITYTYYQLTPANLSDFDLSYSAQFGQFKTFTWGFRYNYFDIFYRDENGDRKKFSIDRENGMLHDPGLIDVKNNTRAISKEQNINRNPVNKKSMLK